MVEFLSYIFNIVFASSYINLRGDDVGKYHADLDDLKKTVKALAIDACACWSNDPNNPEIEKLFVQNQTEIHHLYGTCLTLNRRYEHFAFDQNIGNCLATFKKEATGGGLHGREERIKNINDSSLRLCNAIESCFISKKWLLAIIPWKRI